MSYLARREIYFLTNISMDKSLSSFFGELRVDVGSTKRDVISEISHVHKGLLFLHQALVVKGDKVSSQSSIKLLILRIQHQEDEIKPSERGEEGGGGKREGKGGEGERKGREKEEEKTDSSPHHMHTPFHHPHHAHTTHTLSSHDTLTTHTPSHHMHLPHTLTSHTQNVPYLDMRVCGS